MTFTYNVRREDKAIGYMDELYGMDRLFSVTVHTAEGEYGKQAECPLNFRQ